MTVANKFVDVGPVCLSKRPRFSFQFMRKLIVN